MCTPQEAKEACRKALTEKGENGHSFIEGVLQSEGDAIIRKLTFRFGWALILAVASGTAMWGNLQYRVGNVEEKMSEGGRYTKEQSIEDKARQAETDARQDARISEMREDTSRQLGEVNKKLDEVQRLLLQIARGL